MHSFTTILLFTIYTLLLFKVTLDGNKHPLLVRFYHKLLPFFFFTPSQTLKTLYFHVHAFHFFYYCHTFYFYIYFKPQTALFNVLESQYSFRFTLSIHRSLLPCFYLGLERTPCTFCIVLFCFNAGILPQ